MQAKVLNAIRLFLGFYFLISGIGLFIDPSKAVEVLSSPLFYDLQEYMPIRPFAQVMAVAFIAIISGILYITDKGGRFTVLLACVFIFVFYYPIGDAAIYGVQIPTCGCAGYFEIYLPPTWLYIKSLAIMIMCVGHDFIIQMAKKKAIRLGAHIPNLSERTQKV